MKKVALVLAAVVLLCGVSFAQEKAAPIKAADVKEMVGTVANVTVAEPAKGIADGTVTVVDDTGKAVGFTVTQSTKIVGATLDALTLNQLKIGEKIAIDSKEGTREASAIKVVK